MTRVKKGVHATKKRRSLLEKTKGYRFDRSRKERAAREALFHTATYSFDHRRDKKGDFRRLWSVRISSAVKQHGISYSSFIDTLTKKNCSLNRKMLSSIALENPETFDRLVKQITS